ncbi:MAG: helix-turn-helix domain-containing protein [Balneolales bacterium]|nr:helix-turn-helix domain-containing protein [Balneolales bacterium]
MSDKALIKTIGAFIQYHRLNQNRSQSEVANAAGISRSTLSLLERGEKVSLSSLIQVLRVLDLLYIMDVFHVRDEISPIEYAKLQKNKRQRARSKNSNTNEDLGW